MEIKKNIDGLDLLKGIAAILIVFHHYQQSFKCTFNGINFYGDRINFGFLVELFFMISGYLTIYTARCSKLNITIAQKWQGGTALLHKLKEFIR